MIDVVCSDSFISDCGDTGSRLSEWQQCDFLKQFVAHKLQFELMEPPFFVKIQRLSLVVVVAQMQCKSTISVFVYVSLKGFESQVFVIESNDYLLNLPCS